METFNPIKSKEVLSSYFFKIGKLFMLGAVLFLIVRNNELFWPIKRASEILLFLSGCSAIITIIKNNLWKNLCQIISELQKPFFLIVAGIILATLISWLRYDVNVNSESVLIISRFLVIITLVLLVKFYVSLDNTFAGKIKLAMLAPLIWLPTIFINLTTLNNFSIAKNDGRFQGLENFPSNAGYIFLIAFAIIFNGFIKNFSNNKKIALIYWFLSAGILTLIFWTQSRATWAGLIFIFTFSFFLNWKHIKKRIVLISAITFMIITSFILLPSFPRQALILRIWPQYYQEFSLAKSWETGKLATAGQTSTSNIIQKIIRDKSLPTIETHQPRLMLWPEYAKLLIKNPWGLSINYLSSPKTSIAWSNQPANPQNTPLEIMAYGGLITFAGYLLLWFKGIKNSLAKTNGKPEWNWLPTIMITLLIISLFDSIAVFKPMWLVLALAVSL